MLFRSQAMLFWGHVMQECNQSCWHLKPDNIFYFTQLCISDLMLTLDYHNKSIEGCSNGIGATIIVRDGAGNYRRWFKDSGGKQSLGPIFSKVNGCGADYVVSVYAAAVSISQYFDSADPSIQWIESIRKTSQMGLLASVCNEIGRAHV